MTHDDHIDCDNQLNEAEDRILQLKDELDKAKETIKTLTIFHEDAKKQIKTWTDRWNDLRDEHRWILVEERLPKKHDIYDVSDGRRKWEHLWIQAHKCWRKDGTLHYETITHWRPRVLPEG